MSDNMPENVGTWPKTVEQAVQILFAYLSPEDRAHLKSIPEDELFKLQYTWGQMINRGFGLLTGNMELVQDTGVTDPEQANMVIIKEVWRRLRSGEVN